jgi:hypothetical protein
MATRVVHGGISGPLREALTECAASGLSGLLLVTGDPGGVIHLVDGGVAAIQTPGAPSAEVILLRSHRVSEATWDTAFAASAANGAPMSAELVARSAVGAGELEALLRTALADAMFVLASGLVEECRPQPGPVDCLLPLDPAAEADLLLAEAARRVRVLAGLRGFAGSERDRVIVARRVRRPPGPPPGHSVDEILALADGRRTARDIAFALGRGVYATMLQLAQLRQAGVLTAAPPGPATADEMASNRAHTSADQSDAPGELPQRRKGLPLPRRTPDTGAGLRRAAPHRLLRPRSGRNADPDGTE